MADKHEDPVLSKAAVKRKYLLTDEDLEEVDHELKDNPINKSYAPMKVFKPNDVEKAAIIKWGSLEKLDTELQKRNEKQYNLAEKKENEMRKFWYSEEIYEPMKTFMDNIALPKKSDRDGDDGDSVKSLLNSDIILCYCDCMHSRPPGALGKSVYKNFSSASKVDKSTPYNDRKKLGHFSWVKDEDQLIVNLYVVHKWNLKSKTQAAVPVLNCDALRLALKRLSTALLNEWKKENTNDFCLSIGTYVPYREDTEQFKMILQENFNLLYDVFTNNKISD